MSGYSEFAGQIDAGALRTLAVSPSTARAGRIGADPARAGVDLDLANWRGIVAPPGLTDVERDRVGRTSSSASRPATRGGASCERYGWEDMLLTGPPFRQFLLAEQRRINAVLQRLAAGDVRSRQDATAARSAHHNAAAIAVLAGCPPARMLRRFSTKGSDPLWKSRPSAVTLAAALAGHAVAMPVGGSCRPALAVLMATALFGSRSLVTNLAIGSRCDGSVRAFTAGLGCPSPRSAYTGCERVARCRGVTSGVRVLDAPCGFRVPGSSGFLRLRLSTGRITNLPTDPAHPLACPPLMDPIASRLRRRADAGESVVGVRRAPRWAQPSAYCPASGPR